MVGCKPADTPIKHDQGVGANTNDIPVDLG